MRNGVAGFSHPVSTCAMSPQGAKHGVVDPDLRLKGAEGLRVVDASILVRFVLVISSFPMTDDGFSVADYSCSSHTGFSLRDCRESIRFD